VPFDFFVLDILFFNIPERRLKSSPKGRERLEVIRAARQTGRAMAADEAADRLRAWRARAAGREQARDDHCAFHFASA